METNTINSAIENSIIDNIKLSNMPLLEMKKPLYIRIKKWIKRKWMQFRNPELQRFLDVLENAKKPAILVQSTEIFNAYKSSTQLIHGYPVYVNENLEKGSMVAVDMGMMNYRNFTMKFTL